MLRKRYLPCWITLPATMSRQDHYEEHVIVVASARSNATGQNPVPRAKRLRYDAHTCRHPRRKDPRG